MSQLQIGGRGGPQITLLVPDRPRTAWPDHFTVEMSAPEIQASITVENPPYAPALSDFFKELGNSPSAWDGTRQWRSIEDELEIRATCDPTGHVGLEFEMRPSYGAAQGWRAIVCIVVDLGSVEGMADQLREMFAYENG